MTELSLGEGKSSILRYISTGVYVSVLVVTIVFNGLAGPGEGPFSHPTGEVSDENDLCITPAGFTLAIWGVIYFLLSAIAVYAILILFRGVGFDKSWQLGGAVSVLFLVVLSVNLAFNVGWLFAWDANNMIASAVLLLIIAITNTVALSLAAYSFQSAATRLFSISRFDFWMSIAVLNGQAVYCMWTIIAALVNLGIMIVNISRETKTDTSIEDTETDVCIGILGFLLVIIIIYFALEQSLLKHYANTVFTHYLVYIWAMIGAYVENKDSSSTAVVDLIIANMSMGIIIMVLRFVFLFFRNRGNPMYDTI